MTRLPGDLLLYQQELKELYSKFEGAVTLERVNDWILQFEPKDRSLAIQLALKMAHFSWNDVVQLCKKLYGHLDKIGVKKPCFVGFGRSAESGQLIAYLFRKANGLRQRDFLSFERFGGFDPGRHDALVLLDDFVGTGLQAIEMWNQISGSFESKATPPVVYLALVGFNDAKKTVAAETDMKVELAHELTEVDKATFPLSFGDTFKTQEAIQILEAYGRRLEPEYPLGYGKNAALVSFYYDTPNNTLPVIWSSAKGWTPLFPRHASFKPKRSAKIPRERSMVKNKRNLGILSREEGCARFLAQHEAVFGWETPNYEYESTLDSLNLQARAAVVQANKFKLYALPHLAMTAGLAAGHGTLVSLAKFSGLPINAARETIDRFPQTLELNGPHVSFRRLRGKLIVFDWSDTLVDEYQLDESICDFIPKPPPGREKEQSECIVAFREILSDLERNHSKRWYDYIYLGNQFGKSSKDLHREHLRNKKKLHPLCDIKTLMREIRGRGFLTALATNCVGTVLKWRAEMLNVPVNALFDFVVTSDKVSRVDDKGEQFEYILSRSRLDASEVIVVGDRFDKEILPAKIRGMRTVWVRRPVKRPRSYWGTPELPTPRPAYEAARNSVLGQASDAMILDIGHLPGLLQLRETS